MQTKLDTVKDSDFQSFGLTKQIVRSGMILDITDEDAASPADYFFVVDNAIRSNSNIVSANGTWPGRGDIFYNGAQLTGITGRSVRFKAYFSTFMSSITSTYTISDRCYPAVYEGNLEPGTRKPILIGIDNSDPKKKIKPRLGTMRFKRTMRVLSVTRLLFGDGEAARMQAADWVNTTNNSPFQGLPANYWACNGHFVDVSRYQGYYVKTISAEAKCDEDVSEFQFLRSTITNKYAVDDTTADKVAALLALPYKRGTINDAGDNASTKIGIARVGPFRPASFADLFGFGNSTNLLVSPTTA